MIYEKNNQSGKKNARYFELPDSIKNEIDELYKVDYSAYKIAKIVSGHYPISNTKVENYLKQDGVIKNEE